MIRTILVTAAVLFLHQLAYAQTCPTVADLKHGVPIGWKVIDTDDGGELSSGREVQFRQFAEEFALAEWVGHDSKTGSIHCYYRDKNGSDLEAYLTKDNFIPKNANHYWYQVSGSWQCAAGMDKCNFETGFVQSRLARR